VHTASIIRVILDWKYFLLALASRPALGPTQPPVQWIPGVLSPGVKRGRGVTLTTHPHIVPRLSMSRNKTSSPPPCASVAGSLYFFFTFLYVARRLTNGDFGITGTSEVVPAPFISKSSVDGRIRFKFPIAPIVGRVRGPRVCKMLSGGPRTRSTWEPLF
jgi:hypothetical protein